MRGQERLHPGLSCAFVRKARRVRSATAVGVGVIWVEFDWGTDIYIARQLVAEKLSLVAGTLPPQVERPVLAPISSIMGEILFFALSSDTVDPLTLRTVADTVVRRRLLAIPGVSQVTPIGGAERQFQVVAHPDQLRANSISVNELLEAVRGASQNTSAGIYMEGPQEYVLQTIGRARTPEEIAETVGVPVGTVKSQGASALQKLRALMGDQLDLSDLISKEVPA